MVLLLSVQFMSAGPPVSLRERVADGQLECFFHVDVASTGLLRGRGWWSPALRNVKVPLMTAVEEGREACRCCQKTRAVDLTATPERRVVMVPTDCARTSRSFLLRQRAGQCPMRGRPKVWRRGGGRFRSRRLMNGLLPRQIVAIPCPETLAYIRCGASTTDRRILSDGEAGRGRDGVVEMPLRLEPEYDCSLPINQSINQSIIVL